MNAPLSSLKTSWNALPVYVRVYLGSYFFILFLLMFWVPGNDFDTLSSYIARIKLEEFGDLHQTATLELQYLFPKFFDYLHKPFLELGYFTTLPSFALFFLAGFVLLSYLGHKERLIAAILIMACPPILLAVTSMKNDLALACFALLAWYAIFVRPNATTYLPVSLLALAALAGTKWHGLFVILPLGIGLASQLISTHKPSARAIVVTLLMIPAYWLVSSANVYVDNWVQYGSPMPRPEWLAGQTSGLVQLPANLYRFASSSFVDTFDIPLYFIDHALHWQLWPYLREITAGGKSHTYAFVINSEFSVFGALLLAVLGCAVVSLFRSSEPRAVRAAAATALCYTVLVLICIRYSSWINRYFLTSFLLGLIPAAHLMSRVKIPKTGLTLALTFCLITSLQALLLNQEKMLVPVTRSMPDNTSNKLPPIYPNLLNRDRLYFHVWSGYVHVYDVLMREVRRADGLVFYNTAEGGDVPFLYPFIKDRDAANTRIINVRNAGKWDPSLCADFRYALVYKGKIKDRHYDEIYSYGSARNMTLYRRSEKGCG